jgi:hypothetical protein
VSVLGIIEAQRTRERFKHAVGDPAEVAALHTGVVGEADASEHRDFLSAEAGYAAVVPEHREPNLSGRESSLS